MAVFMVIALLLALPAAAGAAGADDFAAEINAQNSGLLATVTAPDAVSVTGVATKSSAPTIPSGLTVDWTAGAQSKDIDVTVTVDGIVEVRGDALISEISVQSDGYASISGGLLAEVEVESGGRAEISGGEVAMDAKVSENAQLTVSGGAVGSLVNYGTLTVTGGQVSTIACTGGATYIRGNANVTKELSITRLTAVVEGGFIEKVEVVDGTLLLTGGTVGTGRINRLGTGQAYYVGEDKKRLFAASFTEGATRFMLDDANWTSDGSDYQYDKRDPVGSSKPICLTIGYDKLAGADIAVTGTISGKAGDLVGQYARKGGVLTFDEPIHATDVAVSVTNATFEGTKLPDFSLKADGIYYAPHRPAPEPELTVSPSEATLTENETIVLAANRPVSWSTTNARVATVKADGTVTARKAGVATITATAHDGSEAACRVTVEAVEQIGVGIEALAVGKNKTLILPKFKGYEGDWSVGNESIAKLSSNGTRVKALALGETTLTFTVTDAPNAKRALVINDRRLQKGDTYTIKLNVRSKHELVRKVSVDLKKKITLWTVGKNETNFVASVKPDTARDRQVFYISSDPSVALVDAHGYITAVGRGKCKVSAVSTSLRRATITVTVLGAIDIKPAKKALKVGQTWALDAVVADELIDKSVTWKSSAPDVATVDENGVVTAIGKGKATITATASNKETASCTLTVKK